MNRQEFIDALKAGLTVFDGAATAEIIADFEAHFDEAAQSGKTEQETCALLGDPQEIAEQFRQEADAFAPAAPVDPSAMHISLFSANLVCERQGGEAFSVHITQGGREVQDDTITIQKNNGGLEITQPYPTGLSKWFFHAFDHKTIHVGVPERFCGDIRIKMAHGNLHADDLAGNAIVAEIVSGNVRLERLKATTTLDVGCVSGNVALRDCAGETSIKETSGNIDVKAHAGSVSARNTSGNISIETDCMQRPSEVATKSGNIKISVKNLAAPLDVGMLSGNIGLQIERLAGNVTAKTTSGNIKAYFSADTKAIFATQSSVSKNEFSYEAMENASVPVVSLSTRSGVVKVFKL